MPLFPFFSVITVHHEYVLTLIFKLFNTLYLSYIFLLNVDCLSADPLPLYISCTALLLSAGPLPLSLHYCHFGNLSHCQFYGVMLCSYTIKRFFFFSSAMLNLRLSYMSLQCFFLCNIKPSFFETSFTPASCNVTHIKGRLCFWLLLTMLFILYIWHDNESVLTCTVMSIYTSMPCINGVIIFMCLCALLTNPGMSPYWMTVYVSLLHVYYRCRWISAHYRSMYV